MSELLILDQESALRITLVVQNKAIGIKWRDERRSDIFSERLFSEPKDVEMFIADLLEKHLSEV